MYLKTHFAGVKGLWNTVLSDNVIDLFIMVSGSVHYIVL